MAWKEENLARARHRMVETQLRARGIRNPRLLQAFKEVPRERFVPERYRSQAYADHPIDIGLGQTISQPYVVALMISELDPQPADKVLEVGLGSGYQAAILAKLAKHVYAVERLEELTEKAMQALAAIGADNVTTFTADGTLGWPEQAPFDRIIAAAASPNIPDPWRRQLADGGRIVAPVGGPREQSLTVVERHGDEFERRELGGVRFVKLIGKGAWAEHRGDETES